MKVMVKTQGLDKIEKELAELKSSMDQMKMKPKMFVKLSKNPQSFALGKPKRTFLNPIQKEQLIQDSSEITLPMKKLSHKKVSPTESEPTFPMLRLSNLVPSPTFHPWVMKTKDLCDGQYVTWGRPKGKLQSLAKSRKPIGLIKQEVLPLL